VIDVKAYRPGAYVTVNGQAYYILSVRIELAESGMSYEMVQLLTLLAVDAEGNDLGKDSISVNIDMYDIVEH